MATFRILEDAQNKFGGKNMEVSYSNNVQPPQKRMVLKEIDMQGKRLPLRATNNQSKNPSKIFNSKTSMQIKQPSQVLTKKELVIGKTQKENEFQQNSCKLINQIPDFQIFENKENEPTNQDNSDFFQLSPDHIFISTKEYQEHIYSYLLHLERNLKRPKYDYMEKQPELTYKMRSILIDWLSSVSEEYNLHPQTFHLSVHYLDTFLSRMSVVKNKFQLVGTASMLIASKYEEIYPPEMKEFTFLTADSYTNRQLRRMEQLILKVLQFDLAQPTSFSYILHLSAVLNMPRKNMLLAMYFSELVLLEGEEYLRYFPSQLAFAAIALSRHTLQEEVWTSQLETATGYSLKQLTPLIKKQHQSFQDSPTRAQQAIQDKYKTSKYGRVSFMKPRTLNLDD